MLEISKIDINKIALERINQGLSTVQLSKKAGLSKNVVSNIENGYVIPRLHTLGKIVNALGKKIEDFIIEEEEVVWMNCKWLKWKDNVF